jgi:predicted HicB family RNase H-like nuclease
MAQYRKNPRSTRKRTNLTIDPDLWENIQDHCYSQGISVSELVNQLLKANLAEANANKKPVKALKP